MNLIVMNGSTFNEYGKIKNYVVAGFLDEKTDVFTGIETETKMDIGEMEKAYALGEISLVTGMKGHDFIYYAYHRAKGISYHSLKPNGETYFGKKITFKEYSMQTKQGSIEIRDILFQTGMREQNCNVPELEQFISRILEEEKSLVWKGIKGAVTEKAFFHKEKQNHFKHLQKVPSSR